MQCVKIIKIFLINLYIQATIFFKRRKMKEKKSDYLLIKIIAAVILGIVIGFIIKSTSGVFYIKPV